MTRVILPVVALLASASLAYAAPVKMTDTQLDTVVAGWLCGNHVCANNGWGNGFDSINPGSDSGGTALSKTANGSVDGSPNSNPTTSSGR